MGSAPTRWPKMASTGRWLIALMSFAVLLSGCVSNRPEPGLFGNRQPPRVTPTEPTPSRTIPPVVVATNLPVAGEATWTSADSLGLQVRIAIHAVRRIEGATVLDWSITPLRAFGLESGDTIPPIANLGLSRFAEGNLNIFLMDTLGKKLYRPLTHKARQAFQHCLCTPLWVAQRSLRISETRLLQVAFPELPADVHTVDVNVATVAPFWRVPVLAPGMVPLPTNPVRLDRPLEVRPSLLSTEPFTYPRGRQQFVITIDEVIASSTNTAVVWTIQTLTEGDGLDTINRPPFAEDIHDHPTYNAVSASGPQLKLSDGQTLRARRATTNLQDRGTLECLCSDLRLWATSLRSADHRAKVVTNFHPLPRGTQSVDVVFPGLPELEGLSLTTAADSSVRTGGPAAFEAGLWNYLLSRPSTGWTAERWPTPLPDTNQLLDYDATIDDLL